MQNAPITYVLSSVEDQQFQEFGNNESNLKKYCYKILYSLPRSKLPLKTSVSSQNINSSNKDDARN